MNATNAENQENENNISAPEENEKDVKCDIFGFMKVFQQYEKAYEFKVSHFLKRKR